MVDMEGIVDMVEMVDKMDMLVDTSGYGELGRQGGHCGQPDHGGEQRYSYFNGKN